MLRKTKKHRKKLAKLVLAALLCTGGVHYVFSPSVAEAAKLKVTDISWNGSAWEFTPSGSMINDGVGGAYVPANSSVTELSITGGNTTGYGAGVNIFGHYAERSVVSGYKVSVSGTDTELYGSYGITIAGGVSETGNAMKNEVTINGGNLMNQYEQAVIGGRSYKGNVSQNKVTINDGKVSGYSSYSYYGISVAGGLSDSGDAFKNEVVIDGGKVSGYGYVATVAGGYTNSGNATENKVTVSGGVVYNDNYYYGMAVVGGYSGTGKASENEVLISGGAIGDKGSSWTGNVAGGWSYEGDANDNKITVEKKAKIYGNVYGGMTGNTDNYYYYSSTTPGGDASNNTVTISAKGSVVNLAYGGRSVGGNADNNTVNVSGGSVQYAIGGNAVPAIKGSSFRSIAPVEAQKVLEGNATGNTVNISGDAQVVQVIGGATIPVYMSMSSSSTSKLKGTGVANDNTVNISGGKLGFTKKDEDTGKTWNVSGAIFGGGSFGEASNNTVNISGGDMEGAVIIGGMVEPVRMAVPIGLEEEPEVTPSEATGKADNNTVNIMAPVNAGALFGGVIFDGSVRDYTIRTGSGNTLNVAAKNVSTFTVGGFQNMNFYLPKDVKKNDTMLTIKTPKTVYEVGEAAEFYLINKFEKPKEDEEMTDENGNILLTPKPTDLKGVTFGVAALQGVNLKKGDKVTLITDENGLTTDKKLKTKDSKELGKAEFLQQNSMTTEEKYELSIKKEGDKSIVTTVDNIIENETDPDARKSPVETRAAMVTMINAAGDLLAGQGMANAEKAAEEAKSGGSNMFAAVSGNHLRAESGSHVTTKGLGLNLGFAKEIENKSGKLLIGPVLEYGHGNYDSYQNNGMKADGKASYWGIGVIAKQTNNSGFYYEGSLRVGRTKSDYGSDSIVENGHISYDSSATYWAAHLGAGMLKDIGHNNTLDYYGRYFYSHTGSDSTTIYKNGEDFDRVNFDGVNSNRIRVGARVTHAINELNNIYGGLAYQYEFSGSARATYREGAAPSPGIKGSSGLIELGWQVKPGKKSPMEIDIGVTGWVGKQRGITANVQALWTF